MPGHHVGGRRRAPTRIIAFSLAILCSLTWSAPASSAAGPTWLSDDALPRLDNLSSMTDARARALAAEAIAGLGFRTSSNEGPQPNDRVFVGNDYVAWIDETGFVGKLNGLWWLSPTASGDRSFSMRAPDGRPINQLIVGERGDGKWPTGERGAEHIEMPNNIPEPNDDPACAAALSWCNQYSLEEAGSFKAGIIPWWKVCDPSHATYTDHHDPIEVTVTPTSVRLVYEAPLIKMADSTFPYDPTGCHEDWLFPDGVRRRVYLRVGYELYADGAKVDRLMQVRNPAGNPSFGSNYSFIGGFIITTWPDPLAGKELNAYIYPELSDVGDPYTDPARTLVGGSWNVGWTTPTGTDIAFGWMRQPFWVSTAPAMLHARSLRTSMQGPKDNLDTGPCMCQVGQNILLGGGMLHTAPAEDAALPIAGGTLSIESRRRLETAPATVIPDVAPYGAPLSAVVGPAAPTATPASAVTAVPAFTG